MLTLIDTIQLVNESDEQFERFLKDYLKDTNKTYSKAVDSSVNTITKHISKLGAGATEQELQDVVVFHLFRVWKGVFTDKQKSIITKHISKTYKWFRKDKSIFGKDADGIPAGTFDQLDTRSIAYYKQSDGLYLGKFITDDDTRKKISDFISKEYLENGVPIGGDTDDINKFKKKFKGVLNGEDWKIRRVIDTSLNKLRNTATITYMDQANVTEYEILGIEDRKQSDFCKNISGRRFKVSNAIDTINQISNSDPANIAIVNPFGTSLINAKDIPNTSSEALQRMGIGIPPYHGHCRTTIVAVL